MFLEEVKLHLFKGFEEFSIPCSQFTCLVGLNSRGKTTILQAIALLHDILHFAIFRNTLNGNFADPQWNASAEHSLNRLGHADPDAIWLGRRTSEPCRISARYTGNIELRLEVKGRRQYELDVLRGGTSIKTGMAETANSELLRQLVDLRPVFVPPVGPISPLEQFRPYPEIQQQLDQGREADTWRSRLYWFCNDRRKEQFHDVVDLVRRYVPEATVSEPYLTHDSPARIRIDFEEEGTQFDISSSGGGMRTLLNLAVVLYFADSQIYLFDEPESHLHGTLQRAIARMLFDWSHENARQLFVATHGSEFIAELPSSSLAWIDRRESEARKCNEVGSVLADLGALSKADAIRACGADKILFYEGKDRKVYDLLFGLAGEGNPFADPEVVVASLPNGKGDSTHLRVFCKLLRQSLKLQMKIACIVDNDYDLAGDLSGSDENDPSTVVLKLPRKEIENYLIEPEVVHAALIKLREARRDKLVQQIELPTLQDVQKELDQILDSEEIRNLVKCQVVPEYRKSLRGKQDDSTREMAGETWFDTNWKDQQWRIRNCPGYKVLARLRDVSQNSWKLTLTERALVTGMSKCPDELAKIAAGVRHHFYEG